MAKPAAKQIWLKHSEESDVAFAAFKTYRDLGPERSIVKVQKALKKPASYKRMLEQWSTKFDWVKRAETYDAHQDEKTIALQEQAMADQGVDWAKRQLDQREMEWSLAQDLVNRAKAMLAHPLTQEKKSEDGKTTYIVPARWSAADIPKYIEVADKLARLASELPTELVQFMTLLEKKKLSASDVFQDLLNEFSDLDGD